MENGEKQPTIDTPKPKSDTKVDGVSAQINMGVGSETHLRFARLIKESGAVSARVFIDRLLDAYENPVSDPTATEDIRNLHTHIDRLNAEIGELQHTIDDKDAKIKKLEADLEEARRVSNENAESGLGKQLQLDELRQQIDGAVIVKLNPVSRFFLAEMAGKTGTTPDRILEKLFIDDLQNPRANNLPYTVSSSRIREVMEELKRGEE